MARIRRQPVASVSVPDLWLLAARGRPSAEQVTGSARRATLDWLEQLEVEVRAKMVGPEREQVLGEIERVRGRWIGYR